MADRKHALKDGTRLQNGRYVIESLLSTAGFSGFVYRARTAIGDTVAIKEMFPEGCKRNTFFHFLRRSSVNGTRCTVNWGGLRAAFAQECSVLCKLDHPNIVKLLDWFAENDTGYMVLEYLTGVTLGNIVGTKLAISDAINIINQVGWGLHYLHQEGTLHRDIKPDNIFVSENRQVKILDFNISKEFLELEAQSRAGTPQYWAPEQLKAETQDERCDVYALAAVTYELLTGKYPQPVMYRLGRDELVPPRQLNPDIDYAMEQAVLRALTLDVTFRTRTVPQFLSELNPSYATPQPTQSDGEGITLGQILRVIGLAAIFGS